MKIFRLKVNASSDDYRKIKEKLEEECNEKVLLLSKDMELINDVCGIKEEDIRITDVQLEANSISYDVGIVEHILAGTKVSFEYKDISANLFIKGNRLLTIKEMKREIINRFSIQEINVKEDM
ncbi:MAG: hypothetical protein E7K85_13320 [Clostridium sp.]|uniref:hypothetical protein n=1 Tax=Clostridium TaxID=1485 RepID=UPI00232EDE98|nr:MULTISPECIES: hypothetical protein [Clostridium]MDB2121184.1 hypothetical protein [Clostridium paraputrificum]MDU4428678.1 hypothetical protein [Clostridium sp.]MDU7461602.1 hypothetical protein [Clostridium sp.]